MDGSQRFLSSPAAQSSLLSPAFRTRKRSRASSAAGDSLTHNKESEKRCNDSGSESKVRNSKGKVRLMPNIRKNSKSGRVPKKKFGSLQNAVVLAPFYTLKKSFQNKFLNLYAFEKLKNISCKTKAAKNRNIPFEYDIMELKPQMLNVKREGKTTANKANQKPKPKGYCRCNKKKEKNVKKQNENIRKLKRKTSGKELMDNEATNFLENLQNKKKKPNCEIVTQTLKTEFDPGRSLFIPKDKSIITNPGLSSTMSSQSECDSWETSSKEEYMEGALAISTSSFDYYLKNFDKDYWDISEFSGKSIRKKTLEAAGTDFLEKPFGGCSRHLIFERKNSDGHIVDFMDREPQTRVISTEESNQHLQPLRLQSKSKTKKPEPEPACNCHLRSLSSKRRAAPATNQAELSAGESNKALLVEVATQVEKETLEELPPCEPVTDDFCENENIEQENVFKDPTCSSNTNLPFSNLESPLDHPPNNSESDAIENKSSENNIKETETKENTDQESAILENLCPRVETPMP